MNALARLTTPLFSRMFYVLTCCCGWLLEWYCRWRPLWQLCCSLASTKNDFNCILCFFNVLMTHRSVELDCWMVDDLQYMLAS